MENMDVEMSEDFFLPLKIINDTDNTEDSTNHIEIKKSFYSILSYLFFTWTHLPLQISNSKSLKLHNLTVDNVPLFTKSKDNYLKVYKRFYPNNLISSAKSPLFTSLLKANKYDIFIVLTFSFIQASLKILHLNLLRKIIQIYKATETNTHEDYSLYFYATIFLGNKLLQIFLIHHTAYLCQILGAKAKSSLSALVYEKLTRTGAFISGTNYSSGNLINFIQHDAETLSFLFFYAPTTLVVPFQFTMYFYLLFKFFGCTFLFGFLAFFILMILAWIVQKLYFDNQIKLMTTKDERVKLSSTILNILKVIKMYSWEKMFITKIIKTREKELHSMKKILNYSVISGIIHWTIPLLLSSISIGVYTIINGTMNIEDLMTAIEIFDSMSMPLYRLPIFLTSYINNYVSMKRIEKFLYESDEERYSKYNNEQKKNGIDIKLTNCDFGIKNYEIGVDKVLLKGVNIEINEGEMVAILGETGSGKTCFANSLLNRIHLLPKLGVSNSINGNVSYAGQTPWIMNESIKNNIIFYNELDQDRYEEILQICQLTSDLEALPGGELTEVSSNGTNISGGQKARISIARAVYNKGDIYVFDDPISSVDTINVDAIMNKVIFNFLRNKTRIFIKHDLKYLNKVDKIFYLSQGKIIWSGTYNQFTQNQLYHTMLSITPLKEDTRNSERKMSMNEKYTKINFDSDTSMTDKLIKGKLIKEEEQKRGRIPTKLYLSFLKLIGGTILFLSLIFLTFCNECSLIGGNIWLTQWTVNRQDNLYSYLIYIQIGLLSLFFLFLKEFLITRGVLTFNLKLHSSMFERIIFAPINHFHDIVSTGQCLNRLTNDLDKCKNILKLLSQMLKATAGLIGAFVVCTRFNLYSILFAPFLLFVCFCITYYYINGGRDLNRLEGITRTPIVEGFSETILGLSTIKVFHVQMHFKEKFFKNLNDHLLVSFYKFGAMNWYALHLDLCSYLYLCFIIIFSCIFRKNLTAQVIGLLLKYSISFSEKMLNLLEQGTMVEKAMVSYERCDSYTKIIQEKPRELSNDVTLSDWPFEGRITFSKYTARYRPNTDIVLNDLNLEIKPNEKIGVVGQSGSGKSTIVQALFRLIEPLNGSITIDNIDITSIGLKNLRESLCVIPQDPTLIEGTLRHNLDPLRLYKDETIMNVLKDLEFFDYMKQSNHDIALGLRIPIQDLGNNLSLGEKQLICFARAILKKSKIVCLDEATASVDHRCEEIIQKVIEKYFTKCTLISIAHKVEMVMNYDRILVLDKGKVAEFDSPQKLLQKKGLFAKIYQKNL